MTDWIWTPDWNAEDDAEARHVYFRKTFLLSTLPTALQIRISADSRYKLYLNGRFVQEGPAKGDLETWFVDTAELGPYLQEGKNVAAVEVLRYPARLDRRNLSLYRTEWPCLYVEGASLDGSDGWKCHISRNVEFLREPHRPAPLHIRENVKADPVLRGWKEPGYDDGAWSEAKPYDEAEIDLAQSPFNLIPRDIPPMRHAERRFRKTVCVRDGAVPTEAWDALLALGTSLTVPANTAQIVEINAGEEQCGYPAFSFIGGAEAVVTALYSECYASPGGQKGDRTDFQNGRLSGPEDRYAVGGFGTAEQPETCEPFWFRTFRFVRLEIRTESEPLTITGLTYRATGYPLDMKTRARASDESFADIWDISERTLRRCMHETYMDCPFYEQLQYAMDARTEILCTYAVSADDRLARRTMEDFRRSQRSDGILNCCAPTVGANVIPGFSIYYILMVHDHMMWFGDRELVRRHLGCIDGILEFFRRGLTEKGLVGSVGGPLFMERYWSYIDWTKHWDTTSGVPGACRKGDRSLTMESLLYLYGLQAAAELADYAGRIGTAEEYRERAAALAAAIRRECTGADGLLRDGPEVEEYSVHCQVFAILTGLVGPEKGKALLRATVGNDAFAQCSVAMCFYLFRALEVVGWYEKPAANRTVPAQTIP